jgi:hypothetical protein
MRDTDHDYDDHDGADDDHDDDSSEDDNDDGADDDHDDDSSEDDNDDDGADDDHDDDSSEDDNDDGSNHDNAGADDDGSAEGGRASSRADSGCPELHRIALNGKSSREAPPKSGAFCCPGRSTASCPRFIQDWRVHRRSERTLPQAVSLSHRPTVSDVRS